MSAGIFTDRLLGHLAQFGSFSQQGEFLCTQGLAYLLRDPEGERVFTNWLSSVTGNSLSSSLTWQAESYQEDGGRPDLEGMNAEGQPTVKIEAKLGAPFGEGQLESYIAALRAGGQGGALLILVPKSRLEEATEYVCARFGVTGVRPWRIPSKAVEISCSIITWDEVLEALSTVVSARFQDDLGQFYAMYRVFINDDMEPLTKIEQVLAWREKEAWWERLVDLTTRALATGEHVLPFGVDGGVHPYRRRYVCRLVAEVSSCYSIGTRDPFQNHKTPIWLRFHRDTGYFLEIASRLERSEVGVSAIRSQGHLWFPLEVPLNKNREKMIESLVTQVQQIVAVAYPP